MRAPFRALVPGATLALIAGCVSAPSGVLLPALDPEGGPELVTHTSRDTDTGTVIRRWTVQAQPDRPAVRHGVDERWWPDGTRRARRRFDLGEPVGEWRTWHEDGSVASEYGFGEPGGTSEMTFFHPGGALSARGPAQDGVREGVWTYWYEDGTVRQHGTYERGRKGGDWTLYHPSGSLAARGRFEDDRRVGKWELWGPEPPVFEDAGSVGEGDSGEVLQ